MQKRRSGILLPVASLPTPYGIGDLGDAAYRFVDFLRSAGQSSWETLPLLIPDRHGSPFAPPSAMARNWLLVSPDRLTRDGLLPRARLPVPMQPKDSPINFPAVNLRKRALIGWSWLHFQKAASRRRREQFRIFRVREASWLDEYSLFMAIKDRMGGAPWFVWPKALRERDPRVLGRWRKVHEQEIAYFAYGQWLFHTQWLALKRYANTKSIEIIGDLPHFVTHDSVDVWTRPTLFRLDRRHRLTGVSGAPPDPFAPRGQHWGNPVYNWRAMEADGFAWWRLRLRQSLRLYNRLILDHFRGFTAVWEIPANAKNPHAGAWSPVPGTKLFAALRRAFPRLPCIAEDLGNVTDAVNVFRDALAIPGMRILLFGLDGNPRNWHAPRNYPERSVAYTGTHDLPTARGWIREASSRSRTAALRFLHTDAAHFSWRLIETGMRSKSSLFIMPLQDALNLDNRARMNTPGTAKGNWRWRPAEAALAPALAKKIRRMTKRTGRLPPAAP